MNFSIKVKQELFSLIEEMDKYHWLFTKKPDKDFSRTKKWSFNEVIKFILSTVSSSLRDEFNQKYDMYPLYWTNQ